MTNPFATPLTPASADSPLPARAWLLVGMLWVVGCLNYLDRVMLITMRGSIKEAIPMTDAQFGLLTTLFLFVYGALSPIGGFLADRFSRSGIILISLFTWSVTTWLTAHATTFNGLLLTRALMGISEACYLPAAGALIADYHRNKTRSLANGIHLSGVMVGSALGGLGGWMAEQYDWTFAFKFFGIGGVLYTVVLMCFLRDRPRQVTEAGTENATGNRVRMWEAIRSLFSRWEFTVAMLFWGFLGIASWAFVGWMPTYLSETFNLPQGKAGLTTTLYIYSGSLVGMIVAGAWSDRWSRTNPQGRMWVGFIGLCVTAPAVLLVANSTVLGITIVALVVYGITRAFPDVNMMPIICQITDVRYRATGLGILNAFATFVGGATIYIGGALRDAHVDIKIVFQCGAGGLVLCMFLLYLIRPKTMPVE